MVVRKGGFGNWGYDPLSSNRNQITGDGFIMFNPDSKRGSIFGTTKKNDYLDLKTNDQVKYLLRTGLGIDPNQISSSIKNRIAKLIREGTLTYDI